MFTKSITATLVFVLLPVLFSMAGDQEETATGLGRKSEPAKLTERNTATTVWNRNENSNSRLGYFGTTSKRRKDEQRIKESAKALRQAKTSEEQEAARTTLTELLGEDYDARLAEYETYLEKLEEQLQGMREKLAKRREAKEKMIDLRIKVLEAEADDLGWPSRVNGRFGTSLFPGRLESTSNASPRFELTPRPVQPVQPVQPAGLGR